MFPSGTLNFEPGIATQVITILVAGDTTVEPDEGFQVSLSNGSVGTAITTATATGTILTDDSLVSITGTTSVTLPEGNSGATTFTYTLTRTGNVSGSTDVSWSVAGSGTNPASASDFVGGVLPSGTVSFLATETTKTISIDLQGDVVIEPTETFTLSLVSATNGAGVGIGTGLGTITNDDFQTLAAGDIVITGINGDTPDQFSFVPLVDLTPSSQIAFTDNGWNGTALTTNEGIIFYTVPSGGLLAGTKVVVEYTSNTVLSVLTGPGTVTATGSFGLSTSGDSLLVYTGLSTNPNFLFGVTTYGDYVSPTTTNTTLLPSTLTIGASAVAPLGPTLTTDVDNGQYNDASGTSGSPAAIRALVATRTNWLTSDTGLTLSTANFTVSGSTVSPTITATPLTKVYDGVAISILATADDGPDGVEADSNPANFVYTYYAGLNLTGGVIAAPTNVGSYSVDVEYFGNASYNPVGSTAFNITITAAPLTVNGAVASNKAYDATNSAVITGTLSGVIGSDSVTFTGTGTFASTGVNNGIAVTSTSTLSGPGAGNYSLTQPTGLTANITPKELTLTSPLASNKAYDATNAAVITGTLSGVIGSEIVTFTGTGTFASTGVNDGIAVTSTSTLGGTDAGNYSLVQPTGLTANITPKELTGSITASNKIFNGNDAATIVTRSLTGVIGGEDVSYVGGTATFATSAVGNGITVTATGLSLSGAGAGNYSVNTTATTTADIIKEGSIQTRGLRYLANNPLLLGTSASTSLATDKVALRTGTSTFANYTNYSRGLTGVVIDIADLPASTTPAQLASSLQFAQWNGIAAGSFGALSGAAVPTVTIASGDGASGSARVQIQFPDNTVQNTWLRVTVVAGLTTALTANDVFYFGNVIGDFNVGNILTGLPASQRIRVNATDTGAVRSNQSTAANSAPVTNIYDVDRNGRVNATDTGIVRSNQQTAGIVAPITIPGSVPPSAPAGFGFVTPPMKGTPAPVVSAGKVGTEGTKVEDVRNTVNTSVSADILNLAAISKTTTVQQETVVSASGRSDTSTNEVDSNLQSLDEYFASIWKS